MSNTRSRKNNTQGWEEAGGEFYQESYPAEWESFQRDPAAIATLLPSKQNRVATSRRIRNNQQDTQVKRRQTQFNTRSNSIARREIQYQDVQGSALPDLSQDLTDEERIWEEIQEIKSMPVSMTQKKDLKAKLQNATKLRLQGFDQFKWQRRKAWQQLQTKWTEVLAKMELWRSSLKKIEGSFGTGVVAYFLLLRWLMFLNLAIFLLIFFFIIIPHAFLIHPTEEYCNEITSNDSTQCCREFYLNNTSSEFYILDIIQGTGFMENTLLFYGVYTNKLSGNIFHNQTEEIDDTSFLYSNHNNSSYEHKRVSEFNYDLPLVYISITVLYFFISLAAIVRGASREFKDRLVDGEGQFYQYCNLVFGGWDFCIHNGKSADIKHKALYNEIKGLLYSKRIDYERSNRSRDHMYKLVLVRLLVNCAVAFILLLSALFIYFLFNISLKYLEPNFKKGHSLDNFDQTMTFSPEEILKKSNNPKEQFTILFFEFLPYIAIVCLNLLVPNLFNYLCEFEQYSPIFVVKINLFRTVFLRLASLAVLLSRFYHLIIPKTIPQCFDDKYKTPQCWETYIGQQFYKLLITDFVTNIGVTFFVNFPRAIMARHLKTRFVRFVGEQEFELPKHVLDIVYSQTICWLGSFYSPFLPAIATILTFFMFYIKKFQCLINSKPSAILYRASGSNSLFMLILLVSYAVALIPVVYAIAEVYPSRSCGPFRGLPSVWSAATSAFNQMPLTVKNLIFFLGTAGFAIPCFIVLVLFLYYYHALSKANKHMVEVLRNQLVLEGHDKQFLLNRLSSFVKLQQDYQKKMRQFVERDRRQHQPHHILQCEHGNYEECNSIETEN
ncbi:transmembrane channel-like protein 7 isoform X1 [Episyrphus balteatus]|uniref:transmembrane channel-like protein 7 isoform X1 n=2 Tax=Episyrphus balteatus TaxID=286459 RepID=UPI0024851580|nr:transmembrane channel-like protein 7 isoform X1 [Episyrphus balteatus]